MNKPPAYGHGDSPYCCFHPREVVVGVCAHCLKDRLLLLLNKDPTTQQQQGQLRRRRTSSSSISLPKVFALGSSFLQRLDSRHHRPDHDDAAHSDGTTSAASLDDSFISIKFEDNGKATWDSHTKAEAAPPAPVRSSSSSTSVLVVEHAKRGGVTRWRKQVVGRLLQLARWKRSAAALDGKKAAGDRSKARGRGWIRSLTRRRADRPWS
ncbi:uncharacterized protein LOC101757651 [Setaria italica]|uniref:Uncharacterized protein n=1 Tax=Setaria italica TaxID=4555 RepID=K3Z9N2_SETIT|nr:uncharacterized protein LOC101757651 [Setaria italica]